MKRCTVLLVLVLLAAVSSLTAQTKVPAICVYGDYLGGAACPYATDKKGTRAAILILSDTRGVDFGPYMFIVLETVRKNWYPLIPAGKSGKVEIEFAIMSDGKVQEMRLVGPSGDAALNQAAWRGITGSAPFAPLPTAFPGRNVALQFTLQDNP